MYYINIPDQEFRGTRFDCAVDCETSTKCGLQRLQCESRLFNCININQLEHVNYYGFVISNSVPDFMHNALEYGATLTIPDVVSPCWSRLLTYRQY